MSQHDKLLARLLTQPADFTWDELLRLLRMLGYEEQSAGKTGGSRRAFAHAATSVIIRLHKPHPGNILKQYQLKQLIQQLNLTKP
jgi:predicted RNA binding protein YcfA (HicA-like mRNA interferase family)